MSLLTHDTSRADRWTRGSEKSRLARVLGWHHSTIWRKFNGKSRITSSDAITIMAAAEAELSKTDSAPARTLTWNLALKRVLLRQLSYRGG